MLKRYQISISSGSAGALLYISIVPTWFFGSWLLTILTWLAMVIIFILTGALGGKILARWSKRHQQNPKLRTTGVFCWALIVPGVACLILGFWAGIPVVGHVGALCDEFLMAPYVRYGRSYLSVEIFGSPRIEYCSGSPKAVSCSPRSANVRFPDRANLPCGRFGYPATSACYYLAYEPSIFNWRRTLLVVKNGCQQYDIVNADNMGFQGYDENDESGG